MNDENRGRMKKIEGRMIDNSHEFAFWLYESYKKCQKSTIFDIFCMIRKAKGQIMVSWVKGFFIQALDGNREELMKVE